jgi:hypothetical protein
MAARRSSFSELNAFEYIYIYRNAGEQSCAPSWWLSRLVVLVCGISEEQYNFLSILSTTDLQFGANPFPK